MRKVSSYKCPECGMRFKSLAAWGEHLNRIHYGTIPKDYSYARYFYYCTTGKTAGSCVQCHKPTDWNENTGKYSRYCSDPKCKQAYVKTAKKRMVDKYGKTHLLNDPSKQREMLDARSSVYKFRDGGTVKFLSSYERDFLMTAEFTLGLKSKDILGPSPNTYVYMYEGKEHFYIPDFFIPDLNLEIEIKDGGDNPNNHQHMQVDRAKEKLKDEMMIKNPSVNYFKVVDKKYDDFYKFLLDCKLAIDDDVKAKLIEQISAVEGTYDIDSPALESGIYDTSFENPEEVYKVIKSRVKYAEFTKLMTADEVFKQGKGSCHDQSKLAYAFLRNAGVSPKLNFFISYREGDEVGGDTHTFVTYRKGNNVCWFETAWDGECGIHEYPNMNALKEDIKKRHLKTSNGKKYPELEFSSVSPEKLKPGMNLDEYVNACLEEPAKESFLQSTITSDFKSGERYDLSKFKQTELTKSIINANKSQSKLLSHIIIGNKDYKNIAWLDGDKLVAAVSLHYNVADHAWISDFEVMPEYRGHGLSEQIILVCDNQYDGKMLTVYNDNEVAKHVYEKCGFVPFHSYMKATAMRKPEIVKKIPISSMKEIYYEPDKWTVVKKEYEKKYNLKLGPFQGNTYVYTANRKDQLILSIRVDEDDSGTCQIQVLNTCLDLSIIQDVVKKAAEHGGTYFVMCVNDAYNDELIKAGCKPAQKEKDYWIWSIPNAKTTANESALTDSEVPATESTYFSHKDEYFNMDKWAKGRDTNVLFITGLSGSGKSSLAVELSKKFGATYIELDRMMKGYPKTQTRMWNPDEHYEFDDILDEVYSDKSLIVTHDDSSSVKRGKVYKALKKIREYCKAHPNQLYIWEGIILFMIFDPDFFIDKPMIIKGTSMYTSKKRMDRREAKVYDKAHAKEMKIIYKTDEHELSQLRDVMRSRAVPSAVVESALTASERTNFGLPDIKKYPMPDEKHVLLAIQYFNHVEESRERELADNILKRMKELHIAHVNVGENNRFGKYYKPTEDSVMTDWCASEPGMGIIAMESGRGDGFYEPIRLNSNQWCTYKGKKYYPLYIILLKNISPLGSVIRAYTKEDFSHSSISFDSTMQDCYTFGNKWVKAGNLTKKSFGTAHESFGGDSGRFHYPDKTVYHIYVMFFNEKQIKAVRKTVDNIFAHHEDYQYNIEGLFSYIFNKPKTDPNKLFCSQFVSLVINSGKPGILTKDPSMYTPVGLTELRGIFDVEEGTIGTYDKTTVEKRTKRIFEKIVETQNFAALEHTNLLYNADWEDSDSINVSGGFLFPED